jgi:septal ring-binding cell division protein DamX
LLDSYDAKLLENDLRMIGKLIDPDRVFVYRTVAGLKPAYTVVFGSYRTRSEATQAIEALPSPLKTNGPYYRTVRSIRAEIARNSG